MFGESTVLGFDILGRRALHLVFGESLILQLDALGGRPLWVQGSGHGQVHSRQCKRQGSQGEAGD